MMLQLAYFDRGRDPVVMDIGPWMPPAPAAQCSERPWHLLGVHHGGPGGLDMSGGKD
jgi:hypothetical protein